MKILNREFYNRDTLAVAKDLLGKVITHNTGSGTIAGKIAEVEAYKGPIDKAAHSFGSRRTKRNEVMFGSPGHAYVYFIYGMYYCMNIVTENINSPCAVLIRSIEPVLGIDIMAQNRYKKSGGQLTGREIKNLGNGPGKLCIALGINKDYNGIDLCGNILNISDPESNENFKIKSSKRINIDYAEEAIDFPWRFYVEDSPYVPKK
jgi:DNA-3-methyladenine glycosylase